MTKEEYLKKLQEVEDRLDILWKKEQYEQHAQTMNETRTLLDRMEEDPDISREDRIEINARMIKYVQKKK
jgi:hypothetical protein